MDAMKVIYAIFATCFIGGMAVGASVIGGVGAWVLCLLVRMVKPGFAEPYVTPMPEKESGSLTDQKRVALDFMFERRRALMKALHAEHHVTTATINELMQRPIEVDTKDLESIAKLVARPVPPKNIKLEQHLTNKAEYAICKFPDGLQGAPRYLCSKLSKRGKGLVTAFAALPDKSIRLDFVSASRLAMMLPGCFVTPANSAARVATRRHHEKNHAGDASQMGDNNAT